MKYNNPWYGVGVNHSPKKVFDHSGCVVVKSKCGRGCIVKVHEKHNDYLIEGKLVTQRVGFSPKLLNSLVAHILDDEPTDEYFVMRAKEVYLKQL